MLAKRAIEIFPGLPSKSLSEMSSSEDRAASTKLIEYRTPLEIEHEPGHPVVFLADARFVFVEALRCGTQDRKINVGKDHAEYQATVSTLNGSGSSEISLESAGPEPDNTSLPEVRTFTQ